MTYDSCNFNSLTHFHECVQLVETKNMIIFVTCLKGGVGKSTIAVHLAVWLSELGYTVLLVDSDAQASSSTWLQEMKSINEVPCPEYGRLDDPKTFLTELQNLAQKYDHIVIDGPGGVSELNLLAMLRAEIVLIPAAPSPLDFQAVRETVNKVKQAQTVRNGLPRMQMIPNKMQHTILSRELIEGAAQLQLPTTLPIRFLQAYATARSFKSVAWRLDVRGAAEAGEDLQMLFQKALPELYRQKVPPEQGRAGDRPPETPGGPSAEPTD
jgi:chromosome partitioning protein